MSIQVCSLSGQILKKSSFSINIGYTDPSTFDGPIEPNNPTLGNFGVSIGPRMAVKTSLNIPIKDSGSNRIVVSPLLNYLDIWSQHIQDFNFNEETRLRSLYFGFDVHSLPSFRGTKFKADLGFGIYTKILSANSNDNFDPKNNTGLINEKSKPELKGFIFNAILGIGYCRDKASYWIHYNRSINDFYKVSYFAATPIQQFTIGVKFKIYKQIEAK